MNPGVNTKGTEVSQRSRRIEKLFFRALRETSVTFVLTPGEGWNTKIVR